MNNTKIQLAVRLPLVALTGILAFAMNHWLYWTIFAINVVILLLLVFVKENNETN